MATTFPEGHLPNEAGQHIAGRLRINQMLEIRVLTQPFKGRELLHVREFILSNDNVFVPTPKGVTLPIDQLEGALDAVRELREVGDKPGVAATIEHGSSQQVRFSVVTWKGTTKADIRTYYRNRGQLEWLPGKGVRFNLALLSELERALEALDRAISH